MPHGVYMEYNRDPFGTRMMRLPQQTQQVIYNTVREVFSIEAGEKLFGSRSSDEARGGDIELLVGLPPVTEGLERKIMPLVARLQLRIGEQLIDVLVLDPLTPRQLMHDQASATGI